MAAHGLMFHHFTNGTSHPPGQGAIDARELREMLERVGISRILDPSEWTARALEGRLRDEDLCLTLDDGLLCQYEIALPVFEALGLRAFWFVYSSVFEGAVERLEIYRYFRSTAFADVGAFYSTFFEAVRCAHPELWAGAWARFDSSSYLTDYPFYSEGDRWFRFLRDEVLGVERYNTVMDSILAEAGFDTAAAARHLWLDDDRLRELHAAGHVIGLHSTTHPTRLERLPPEQQKEEYRHNFDHVRRVTGTAPQTAAHPCNSYSAETLRILDGLGIRMAFRSNMATAPEHGLLELPREDHANLRVQAC